MVAPAAAGFSGSLHIHRLRDVGGFSGQSFRVRSVPVAVLFAAALRRQPARVVRAEPGLVAGRASVFGGAADSLGAGRISRSPATTIAARTTKSFWADPPACTVGEPRKTYLGERSFPLVLQNVHRYFLYLGLFFICILTVDAIKAFRFADPATGATHFGIGVGSLLLTAQHDPAGRLYVQLPFAAASDRRRPRRDLDVAGMRWACYSCVSGLNRRHQLFAWCSLFSVGFADLYVRLCSMGIWTDFRIL